MINLLQVSTQYIRVLTKRGFDMNKEDRKFDILYSIIKDYIKTAEPVGSRTIEKKYNIGISSATIRNEMADLEEMGYLLQPHTSAGRIPSDKAYRLYVDQFMKTMDIDSYISKDVRELYNHYFGELNEVLKKTAQVLTKLTNLTSLITMPNMSGLNIKDIRIIPIEKERILLVVITKQGIVRNTELRLSYEVAQESLDKLTNFLNLCINDLHAEIAIANFTQAIDQLTPPEQKILSEIVEAIKVIFSEQKESTVYSNGITEIFRYPEFRNDMDKAKNFLEALHRQDLLAHLFTIAENDSVNIRIGNENGCDELADCSVVSATYKLNGRPIGTVGIVGPTRIDYDYCVSVLNAMTKELTNHLNESIGGKD